MKDINDHVSKEFLRTAVSVYEKDQATLGKLAEWFFAPRNTVEDYLAELSHEHENGIGCDDG